MLAYSVATAIKTEQRQPTAGKPGFPDDGTIIAWTLPSIAGWKERRLQRQLSKATLTNSSDIFVFGDTGQEPQYQSNLTQHPICCDLDVTPVPWPLNVPLDGKPAKKHTLEQP